jgi:hypothetical protein
MESSDENVVTMKIHHHNKYEWIGDTLVAGLTYHTRKDAIKLLSNKRLLFAGDSLSRRLAYSLYTFLKYENPTPRQINKDPTGHKTITNVVPDNNITITSWWTPLMKNYLEKRHHISDFDYVFVSIGLHDSTYGGVESYNIIDEYLDVVIDDLNKIRLRTCPYPDKALNRTIIDKINTELRKRVPQSRLVDANRMMTGRDIGDTRIKGNSKEHFGPAARAMFVQATLDNIATNP